MNHMTTNQEGAQLCGLQQFCPKQPFSVRPQSTAAPPPCRSTPGGTCCCARWPAGRPPPPPHRAGYTGWSGGPPAPVGTAGTQIEYGQAAHTMDRHGSVCCAACPSCTPEPHLQAPQVGRALQLDSEGAGGARSACAFNRAQRGPPAAAAAAWGDAGFQGVAVGDVDVQDLLHAAEELLHAGACRRVGGLASIAASAYSQ